MQCREQALATSDADSDDQTCQRYHSTSPRSCNIRRDTGNRAIKLLATKYNRRGDSRQVQLLIWSYLLRGQPDHTAEVDLEPSSSIPRSTEFTR
jgi:hypothetical protein